MSSTVVHKATNPKSVFLKETISTEAQQGAEAECQPYFVDPERLPPSQVEELTRLELLDEGHFCLLREKHQQYLSQVWTKPSLRSGFVSLDSSRPWILYWCLHGYDLISDELPSDQDCCRMVETLESCWKADDVELDATKNPLWNFQTDPILKLGQGETKIVQTAGGFAGGPGQMAHAATTYASVLALCIFASATEETHQSSSRAKARSFLERIRKPLYVWFLSLQQSSNGSYRMHHDGEMDVRASYTIICSAKLLNLCTDNLCTEAVAQFVGQCQTYEGGLGGEPFTEAHGGYAYCGLAALKLMNRMDVLDVEALRGWLVRRQMSYEGGFSGRTNKLVDGCYSFWQGGAMAIASIMSDPSQDSPTDPWLSQQQLPENLLFDAPMLQRYILLCAQDVQGGLRDKPSKGRDFYHSCYNLSGFSVSQHYDDRERFGHRKKGKVHRTHPCYNIRADRVQTVLDHFAAL